MALFFLKSNNKISLRLKNQFSEKVILEEDGYQIPEIFFEKLKSNNNMNKIYLIKKTKIYSA